MQTLPRLRLAAFPLGLLCASLASLAGGALLAVQFHGVLRFAIGIGGFAGYVGLFARAIEGIGHAAP
jgi:hypothetical protein